MSRGRHLRHVAWVLLFSILGVLVVALGWSVWAWYRSGSRISKLAFSPSGQRLAVVYEAGSGRPNVELWDLAATPPQSIPLGLRAESGTFLNHHRHGFAFVDEDTLVTVQSYETGGDDVVFWDVNRDRAVRAVSLPFPFGFHYDISGDGRVFVADVSRGDEDDVEIWDLKSNRRLATWSPSCVVSHLQVSANGETLVVAPSVLHALGPDPSAGQTLYVGRTDTELWQEIPIQTIDYGSAISPDGRSLAVCTPTSVELWQLDTMEHRYLAERFWPRVDIVEFSADGSSLIVMREKGQLELWDLTSEPRTGYVPVSEPAPTSTPAFAHSPASTHWATMRHHEVWLWNAASGDEVMLTTTNGTWLQCPLIYFGGLAAWGLFLLFLTVMQLSRRERCAADNAPFEQENIVSASVVSEDIPNERGS